MLFHVQSPATINSSCSCKYSVLVQIKQWGRKSATQKMRATCEKLCSSAVTGTAIAEMLLHSCSAVPKARKDSCSFYEGVFYYYYFIFKENSKLFSNSGWIWLIKSLTRGKALQMLPLWRTSAWEGEEELAYPALMLCVYQQRRDSGWLCVTFHITFLSMLNQTVKELIQAEGSN